MEKQRNLKTADLARASGMEQPRPAESGATHEAAWKAEPHWPEKQTSQENAAQAAQDTPALIDSSDAESLRSRWNEIQVSFVDQPRQAVGEADGLVADTMKRLAENFSKERSRLESQWDRGDQVSTEDLRQALQKYRSFFNRLLAA